MYVYKDIKTVFELGKYSMYGDYVLSCPRTGYDIPVDHIKMLPNYSDVFNTENLKAFEKGLRNIRVAEMTVQGHRKRMLLEVLGIMARQSW